MLWHQLYEKSSQFAENDNSVQKVISNIEQLASRSWYKPSAGCLLLFSISLLQITVVGIAPKYVALVGNVVMCCYKEMYGEIMLQKIDFKGSADSYRVVWYQSADYLRDVALYEEAKTVRLCL